MNKETLEKSLLDIKEKSRGSLSKGMSFLRSAANSHALNANVSNTNDGQTTHETGTDKPSYDQLLALSMKLTRQNKLMKVQSEEIQAHSDIMRDNLDILNTFLSEKLGMNSFSFGLSSDSKDARINKPLLYQTYEHHRRIANEQDAIKQEESSTTRKSPHIPPLRHFEQYEEIDLMTALSPREHSDSVVCELNEVLSAQSDEKLSQQRHGHRPQQYESSSSLELIRMLEEEKCTWKCAFQVLKDDTTARIQALQAKEAMLTQEIARSNTDHEQQVHEKPYLRRIRSDSQIINDRTPYESAQRHDTLEHRLETEDTVAQLEIQRWKSAFEELQERSREELKEARANVSKCVQDLDTKLQSETESYQNKLEILATELDEACKRNSAYDHELKEKNIALQSLKESHKQSTEEVWTLRKELEELQHDLEMATKALENFANDLEKEKAQKEASECKSKNLERELHESLSSYNALQKEKETIVHRLSEERANVTHKLNEMSVRNEEMEMQCQALRLSLGEIQNCADDLQTQLTQASNAKSQLEMQLSETRKALSEKVAFASRIQTEHIGIAGKHAEQAAMIETARKKASECEKAKCAAEKEMALLRSQNTELIDKYDCAVIDKERAQMALEEQFTTRELAHIQALAMNKMSLEAERVKMEAEIARIHKEAKNKSRLARQVVSEKEGAIERLNQRIAELEEDIRSGEADNRKILAFAQLQARREAENRSKSQEISLLRHELTVKNTQIQALLHEKAVKERELVTILQSQRRDGVNLDYLKNIIVQYMSFRPGSSQQRRLLPVISTLLQFSSNDIKEIKKNAARRSSWSSWAASEHHRTIVNRLEASTSSVAVPSVANDAERVNGLFTLSETVTWSSSPPSSRASISDVPSGLDEIIDEEGRDAVDGTESIDF